LIVLAQPFLVALRKLRIFTRLKRQVQFVFVVRFPGSQRILFERLLLFLTLNIITDRFMLYQIRRTLPCVNQVLDSTLQFVIKFNQNGH